MCVCVSVWVLAVSASSLLVNDLGKQHVYTSPLMECCSFQSLGHTDEQGTADYMNDRNRRSQDGVQAYVLT